MKKIRVLIIDKAIGYPIRDGLLEIIKYDKKDTISEVIDRLSYESDEGMNCIENDFEKYLFSCYSHMIGKINWDLDVYNIKIDSLVKCTKKDFLLVNCKGGMGSTGGDIFINMVIGLLVNLISWVCGKMFGLIVTRRGAINILEEEANREYSIIKEVIDYFDEWECGFITDNKFYKKNKVEKKIMKSLGYVQNNGRWIRK